MAQKFITKKNRHLFRRPIKAKIEEKIVITLPVQEIVTVEPVVIEPEVINPETVEPEIIEVETNKKKRIKKVKETEGESDLENKE